MIHNRKKILQDGKFYERDDGKILYKIIRTDISGVEDDKSTNEVAILCIGSEKHLYSAIEATCVYKVYLPNPHLKEVSLEYINLKYIKD